MVLSAGTTLGPYEVIAAIGAGGMGEVYRARDSKLNREVALKLLPGSLAHDPDRLARFRREAQVLAVLNHPHIAQIYGLEDSTNQPALVMELITGRTLADVMAQGPMPWQEAVPIARQIAEALEAAHESGIVHRDLKPANVKVRDDGVVKVLDFGLAKAIEAVGTDAAAGIAGPGPDNGVSAWATMTSPVLVRRGSNETEAGVILGTAAYMAPEQAMGRAVDKRADIWAFGVVLAEMLIGSSLFAGESMTETIAAVIKDDPKLDRLPAETPHRLRRLLVRCLERDPKQRLRDIGEARILLSRPIEEEPPGSRAPVHRARWAAALLGGILLAVTAGVVTWMLRPVPSVPLRRFDLPEALANVADFAIAPDGSRLAYILDGRLFVRRLDELDAKDLGRVHVTARQVVWSPDGGTIAFIAEGSIVSIPADGGPHFVISKVPASGRVTSMTWLPDGKILVCVWRDSLYEVPSTGGTPVVRLAVDASAEIDFHHVSALPDGRLVIATHRRQEDSDVIELVDAQRRTVLTADRNVSAFEYVSPGILLFRRGTTNAGIWAVPFDGGPVDVNAATLVQAGASAYRAAADGSVVTVIPAVSKAALVWVDGSGAETAVPGPIVESPEDELELSPDGDRVAFVQGRRVEAGGGVGSTPGSVVVRDLRVGVDTRLTTGATGGMWAEAGMPTWFPGGDRLVHRTGGVENLKLVEQRADVTGDARELTPGAMGRILSDGKTLIYVRDERGRGRMRMSVITSDVTREDRPLFPDGHQANVRDFDISSDGRLVAYEAIQPNKRADIYLSALRDVNAQRLVREGGVRPRFSRDGSELFFAAGGEDERGQRRGRLMRVPVTVGSSIALGPPSEILREVPNGPRLTTYDVAPRGDRFLMWKPVPASPDERPRLVFVQNALSVVRR
jgi:Tol biopolymer transport system component